MRRFFVHPDDMTDTLARLRGSEARHLASVLRLSGGATVELFDATGMLYQGRVLRASPALVEVEITGRRRQSSPVPSPITLAMGLIKGKKMDMLVRRATELGVARFIPLETRYCENRGRRDRQLDRWQRIVLQACKQCRRITPMRVDAPHPLADLDTRDHRHRIMAWEDEDQGGFPAGLATEPGPICLLVGPEGGFHPDEVAWARQQGFVRVSLGPLVLPAETAALTAVAIAGHLSGQLGPRR